MVKTDECVNQMGPAPVVFRMATAYWASQTIYVAAKLGVAFSHHQSEIVFPGDFIAGNQQDSASEDSCGGIQGRIESGCLITSGATRW